MNVRDAQIGDVPSLERLWRAFQQELAKLSDPPWLDFDLDREVAELPARIGREIALVVEGASGGVVGFAFAHRAGRRVGLLADLYVEPAARGTGVAAQLVERVAARLHDLGVDTIQLVVLAANANARALYARWGFREHELTLVAPLGTLAQRLAYGAANVSAARGSNS